MARNGLTDSRLGVDALKAFRQACRFSECDPSKQVAFDIFSL